ncbi:MAG: branched-chain amino acid ABC transporter permease [Alphaproteobacteria bacterium]|nr:branched-chain amino acid ABC transporter permease [Alphaproteobacteria bacterium]
MRKPGVVSSRALVTLVIIAVLALVPPVAATIGEGFYVDVFTRIMIFAIAALSLDIILGYGGMVSFGHAAYLGIGAYAVGILAFYGVDNGFLQFGTAILASAVAALFIGFVSLRTSGIYFIMITLAFAQMIYFLSISLNTYGGDNGLNIDRPSDFARLVNLSNATTLYYVVFAVLMLFLFLGQRLVNSRFGMVIRGAKSNERRMAAIGFPLLRYKLTAFVIAGAMCGVAGALLANQDLFVAPAVMQWTRSGEILMMVILGGMGTLVGPILGAVAFLALETVLSDLTGHWQAIMGPILVLVVLFARDGIFGLLSRIGVERSRG